MSPRLLEAISTVRRLAFFENFCHRRSAWQLSSILQTKPISCYSRRKHHLRPPRSAFSSTLSRCVKAEEIPGAIATAKAGGAEALYIGGDPIFNSPTSRVSELAAQAGLPPIYLARSL